MVHEIMHSTLSTTSLFNGLLWNAGKKFGYGLRTDANLNNFWNMDLPAWGYDSSVGVNGTYLTFFYKVLKDLMIEKEPQLRLLLYFVSSFRIIRLTMCNRNTAQMFNLLD